MPSSFSSFQEYSYRYPGRKIAARKALAWLGHSNSDMLDLYYHLHDDDSMQTMMELAKSSSSESLTIKKGGIIA